MKVKDVQDVVGVSTQLKKFWPREDHGIKNASIVVNVTKP
jgi:hypothetical protein